MLNQLLRNAIAFFDGFLYGLSESARRERRQPTIALLEAAPPLLLLPPARELLTPTEEAIAIMSETGSISRSRLIEFIDEFLEAADYQESPELSLSTPANYQEPPEFSIVPEAIAPPEISRADVVTALLDEAWTQGLQTYEALIGYVREHSGKGCSRREVSAWKKARKLNDSQQNQAA